jgi:hypothetical protein
MSDLPEKWKKSEPSLRAVQLAFEFSKPISEAIRQQAHTHGISTSDQIRSIIGLPAKKARRPRLTVSLSEADYQLLSERYGIPISDKQAIRQAIADEVVAYAQTQQGRLSD